MNYMEFNHKKEGSIRVILERLTNIEQGMHATMQLLLNKHKSWWLYVVILVKKESRKNKEKKFCCLLLKTKK